MEIINSEQNQWIKRIRLLQKRKFREELGQFVIEGQRFLHEAIIHKADIEMILISEKEMDSLPIQELLKANERKVLVVKDSLLEKSLMTVTPQGIAAIIHGKKWNKKDVLEGKIVIIIDGIQDPGNLGTIIRTALGAGVDGIFCLKGTVDLYNDKTLRATMGSVFNLPVFLEEDAQVLMKDLYQHGYKVVMADPKGELYYYECSFPEKVALVLGSEAKGPINIKEADLKIKIPLHPKVESLNVAVAGGILMYEVMRQRTGINNDCCVT